MLDANSADLTFKTEAQVNAYARFFLDSNPLETEKEFLNDEDRSEFDIRRERNLKSQLDHFKEIDFSKANKNRVDATYYKIVESQHSKPLSSVGSISKSSRFNYKNNPLLRNRSIYFGKTKLCCEIELFHLDYNREVLRKTYLEAKSSDDIQFNRHTLYEYDISIDNILILTTKPSLNAISVSASTFMNEWFDINDTYEIPSASQILGTIARIQGYKGILYKSVRYQLENNLVIFEENTGELNFQSKSKIDYFPAEELTSN